MACKALDDQVAVPTDDELQGLLNQFVCVRLVQMHGVDLNRFAFDGALTWAIFFMNHDGTIYGRYGSRSGLQKLSDREISLAGFKKSIQGAMELHERYRQDQDTIGQQLSGKQVSSKPPWRTPEQIPLLKQNARFNRPYTGQAGRYAGCIHCHMVSTNEMKSLREMGKPIPTRKFFPYPLPDAVGMHMNPRELATVQRVQANSIAATAGIRPGDRILRLGGQPIISTADLQWVLHNAADKDTIEVQIKRNSDANERPPTKTISLKLPDGWRLGLSDWRFFNRGLLRQLLGFNVKQMSTQQAKRLGLDGKMALLVDRTSRDVAMQTGLGIVAIDGKREPMTVGALTAYVFRNKKKGSKLKITTMQISNRTPRRERAFEFTVK